MKSIRRHLTYGNIMATAAMFLALGGTSYAAVMITGKQIKNGSIQVVDLSAAARSALKGAQGPTGPQGPQGFRGSNGDQGIQGLLGTPGTNGTPGTPGDDGIDGLNGAPIVAYASSTGPVGVPQGAASPSIPLANNTWTKGQWEENLFLVSLRYVAPSSCTGPSGGLQIALYADGVYVSNVWEAWKGQSGPASYFLLATQAYESTGSEETPVLTAEAINWCTAAGQDFTVTSLGVNVVKLDF